MLKKLILVVVLIVSAPAEEKGILLQGRVVNEDGQPLVAASVTILQEGTLLQSTQTSSEGTFIVALAKPGQYDIAISLDGFRPHSESINVQREEMKVFQLLPSSLHVVVLDIQQEKLSDAVVTVKGEDGVVRRAIESPKGDYYFGRLKPGIYQLEVSMPGYEVAVDDGVYIPPDNRTMLRTQILVRASAIPLADKPKQRYVFPQLPSNRVLALTQDGSGAIWVGTAKGVARFSGRDGEDIQDHDKLNGFEVEQIVEQSDGTYWFVTDKGLYYRKPASYCCEQFQLPGRRVRAVLENKGRIWIATDRGLISLHAGIWTEYSTKQGLPSEDIRCLAASQRSEALLAGTAAGLVEVANGRMRLIDTDPALSILEDSQGRTWILTGEKVKYFDGESVKAFDKLSQPATKVAEDRFGNVWFAGLRHGVYVYDPLRDEVGKFYQSDRILALLVDKEGSLWFGTENGLIYQDFSSFVNFDTSKGLQVTDIRSLAVDPSGRSNLWVGTAAGLIHFDGVRFSRVTAIPTEVTVNHIIADSERALWVATTNGLYRSFAGRWTRFSTSDGLPSNDIRSICEDDRRKGLWVATEKGVVHFGAPSQVSLLQIKAAVRHIYRQPGGLLWFAADRGVYRYDPSRNDLTIVQLDSSDVRWIEEDSGMLLFATSKGIELCDGQKLVCKQLPALIGESMNVLLRDRDGMFWLGAEDGKIRKLRYTGLPEVGYEGAVLVSYPADRYDIAGNSIRSIVQDKSGAIWFATDAGLVRHLPNLVVPKIECRLEVNGAERAPGEIEAGRHNVKFKFWAVGANLETGFIYRMLINGQPQEFRWLSHQSGRREATFNALGEGEHTFELRAVNRDLYFSQPLRLSIKIDRPFWKKLHLQLLFILTLTTATATLALVRRYQTKGYPFLVTKDFQPIEPNPYIAGNPIRSPSMFFGREDDFNYARLKLEGATQGGVVLVFCGERRAGKSSILYQIANGRLGEQFVPVFIDLQEMVVSTDGEFFDRVARLILEAIRQRELGELDTEQFPFRDSKCNAFHLFSDFISIALSAIGERRLVILIDEYELLEDKVKDGKLSKEIFAFLASLIESRDRLSFIFTGSRRLEERDRRYWREMLRRSLFRKVSFLSERDTLRLITVPVKGKVKYGRKAAERIQRLTGGQPFYTQYICQSMVDYLNEKRSNYVSEQDIERIAEEVVDNPLPQMIYFWQGFSADEKLVMSLLAEVLDKPESVATAARIAKVVAKQGYPVLLSENSIRLILEELVRADVLKRIGDEGYCFRLDLFRLWIRKSHGFWSIVREVA